MIKHKDIKIRVLIILGIIALSFFYAHPIKEKIKMGLDLEGGMYVLLRADLDDNVDQKQKSEAIEGAIEIIRNRIDEFGVKEPTIQLQGKESLLIQLPGEVDRNRAIKLIGQTAFLEFKLVSQDKEKLQQAISGQVPQGYELHYLNDEPLLLFEEAAVSGTDLKYASPGFDQSMLPNVHLEFNEEGTKKFGKVTQEHVGERLAILLDGKVYKSAPVINEPILTGQAQITGRFTVEEAKDLALVLRAGALPCPLIIEEERTVGPLLGADSIRRGINSILLGAALVAFFMCVYYLFGGIVAVVCLVLDLLFIMAGLSLFQATLTLPGIAGMILTLGMAVDANVLIFERIREELNIGKPLSLAVKNGFDKAKRTIIDANITTLIAAVFLFNYGTGPIRGFATTLSLGIAASIFTAVFVGRTIFSIVLNQGKSKMRMLSLLKEPKINFVGIRKICLVISVAVVAFGIYKFNAVGEDMYGIDFSGGQVLEYKLTPAADIEEIRTLLTEKGLTDITLQKFKDIEGGIIIKSKDDITEKVEPILEGNYEKLEHLNVTTIGPSVGEALKKKAFLAVIMSLLVILIYVGLRFKHFDFAFAGIVALFHDVLISLGFLALFGYQVTLLTITALLTIAGYSINDTIVVYDRIRELRPKLHKLPLKDVINTAINQTLSRTIITSFTTILVVLSIYLLGGAPLRDFSFTLLVGFIAGTYSSIFIASPLVLIFESFGKGKKK